MKHPKCLEKINPSRDCCLVAVAIVFSHFPIIFCRPNSTTPTTKKFLRILFKKYYPFFVKVSPFIALQIFERIGSKRKLPWEGRNGFGARKKKPEPGYGSSHREKFRHPVVAVDIGSRKDSKEKIIQAVGPTHSKKTRRWCPLTISANMPGLHNNSVATWRRTSFSATRPEKKSNIEETWTFYRLLMAHHQHFNCTNLLDGSTRRPAVDVGGANLS